MRRPFLRLCCLIGALCLCAPAFADIGKFEIDGRIYSKHLYQNNDSQGLVGLGNPFWPDTISGNNGVGSELELNIRGKVSSFVETGARLASRFGERWHDWWESGNSLYDKANTSGDSGGMNSASYMKLRGTYIQVLPGFLGIDWLRAGSSDLAMFNPWTIGKVRYIDRDNGRGYFASGHIGDDATVRYQLGIIALPKLWAGPWWSTGIGDPALSNAFWSRDWAYATSVRVQVADGTALRLVATTTQDLEVDLSDPDAVGSKNPNCLDKLGNAIPGCQNNHAVDLLTRFASYNSTLDFESDLSDTVRLTGLVGVSAQNINRNLVANGVARNQGVSPVVYKDTRDFATTLRFAANDPFDSGWSLQAEYFNIGADWNAIFGARREADVLLTDGFVGGGGQLPTLNLANEFIDFDDQWVESCIGWHGGTGVLSFDRDDNRLKAEYSFIGYNTNQQNRDVDTIYPDFLHGDGFTDTSLYDYANVTDRGRDPRSVYHRNQDRRSQIAMISASHQFDVGRGLDVEFKAKYIRDEDFRSLTTADDDYRGDILIGRGRVAVPVYDGVKVSVFGQMDHWDEQKRRGTLQLGYGNDTTDKQTAGVTLDVLFGGMKLRYGLEYVHKVQGREREPDQLWNVWRSKATIEANW